MRYMQDGGEHFENARSGHHEAFHVYRSVGCAAEWQEVKRGPALQYHTWVIYHWHDSTDSMVVSCLVLR